MNIYELAMEYGHAADLLRGRIRQLEQERSRRKMSGPSCSWTAGSGRCAPCIGRSGTQRVIWKDIMPGSTRRNGGRKDEEDFV